MTTAHTWIEEYLEGYTLEWSANYKDWYPVTEEPHAGDGKYYRRLNDAAYFVPTKSKQQVPHSTFN